MKRGIFLGLGLALLVCGTGWARERVEFTDSGEDGYTLVLWGDDHPDDELEKILTRIRATGARHLTLPYFGCQTDIHSSDVGACEVDRASRPFTEALAKKAIAHGFHVSFLPIVVTPNWEWRGFFEPKDLDAWFAAYTKWIVGVAKLQSSLGMTTEMIVGTEFSKLYAYEDRWSGVLRAVREVFRGPLILTVNWGDLEHSFWNDADAIGVSNYYPLSDRVSPTQTELDQAWIRLRGTLKAASAKYGRPIHITEIGYPSADTAAMRPWEIPKDAHSDPGLQARCFEAFKRAWSGDHSLARVNVWATGAPGEDPNLLGFETIGKPAEMVLRSLFFSRHW